MANTDRVLSLGAGPAMGDIRLMERGRTLWLTQDVVQRKDWPRYGDAIASAVLRGVNVRWVSG